MRINSNIASLKAQRQMSQTTQALARALERLSSGCRVNSARDDASALAISEGLHAQIRGMRQGVLNANQALGYLQTAEGTMMTQLDLVQRMRELAVQASNGTLGIEDRKNIDRELQGLYEEFQRLTSQSNFNGQNLLDGTFSTMTLQVGATKYDTIDMNIGSTRASEIFTRTQQFGSGQFTNAGTYSGTGAYPRGTQLQDLNGDGHLDMFFYRYTSSNAIVRLGRGDGTFGSEISSTIPETGGLFEDFDGDGDKDLLSVSQGGAVSFSIVKNNGSASFAVTQTITVAGGGSMGDGAAYDLDGDGDKDIILGNNSAANTEVYLNDGTGNFTFKQALSVGSQPHFGAQSIGDFNGDHIADMIIGNRGAGNASVFLGNGDGGFTQGATLTTGAVGPSTTYIDDVTGDGIQDAIITTWDGFQTQIWRGDGSGGFVSHQSIPLSAAGSSNTVRADDLNGDGKKDMVISDGNITYVYFQNGSGTMSLQQTMLGNPGNTDLNSINQMNYIRDIDGDGYTDIMTTSNSNSFNFYKGSSSGHFTYVNAFPTTNATTIHIGGFGDIDEDGFTDFLYENRTNQFVGVALQGDAAFTDNPTIDVSTQAKAQDMLEVFEEALSNLSSRLSNIGAQMGRLDYATNVASITTENLSQARSMMIDADIATETAELVRLQILQQANSSVLNQANISLQVVLGLLRF